MYRRYRDEMATKTGLKIVLFLGSTREGRLGPRVSKFMARELEKRNHHVDVFDPVDLKFPVLEKAIHHYSDRSAIPAWMVDCETKIKEADAYVVVSAEYNFSIPPALSNMLDHFDPNLFAYKPCGIVTYSMGIYGGITASNQLRCLLAVLRATAATNFFAIPQVQNAFDEEGTPLDENMGRRAGKLIDELEWLGWAMKNHKEKFGTPVEVKSW